MVKGKALVVLRGDCDFSQKALVAQSLGAKTLLIASNKSLVSLFWLYMIHCNKLRSYPLNVSEIRMWHTSGGFYLNIDIFSVIQMFLFPIIVVSAALCSFNSLSCIKCPKARQVYQNVFLKNLLCSFTFQVTPSANDSEYAKVLIPLALMRYRDFLQAQQVSQFSIVLTPLFSYFCFYWGLFDK